MFFNVFWSSLVSHVLWYCYFVGSCCLWLFFGYRVKLVYNYLPLKRDSSQVITNQLIFINLGYSQKLELFENISQSSYPTTSQCTVLSVQLWQRLCVCIYVCVCYLHSSRPHSLHLKHFLRIVFTFLQVLPKHCFSLIMLTLISHLQW